MSSLDQSSSTKKTNTTSTTTAAAPIVHLRHHHTDNLSPRRIIFHILKVGVRMAAFRLIFGFVKQLLIKGAIVKGFKKITVGIETEVISYNPLKWACFGMSFAAYRPVQVILEKLLKTFIIPSSSHPQKKSDENENSSTSSTTSAQHPQHEHEHTFELARFISIIASGVLISLPINRVFAKTTRVELMLYVVVRAIHSLLSGIIYPSGILPEFMYRLPTSFWNSTALGAVSAVLLGGSTFYPDCHSKEYANFLVTATTMSKHQMQSLNCMHGNHWSPAVADLCSRVGLTDVLAAINTNAVTGVKTVPTEKLCRVIHPKFSSCTFANFDHIYRHFMTVSLPLYGPLKIVTTLMKGPGAIMKNPVKILKGVVTSVFKSGMFLTLYVCGSYRITCLFNQFGIRSRAGSAIACGVNCGLALMLEPVERQTDLVLFCSMHALRCAYLMAHKMNYIPRPTMTTVATAHSIAWASIFLVYEMRPHTLRGIFATMLKFFIGDRKETHPETVTAKHQQQHHKDKYSNSKVDVPAITQQQQGSSSNNIVGSDDEGKKRVTFTESE